MILTLSNSAPHPSARIKSVDTLAGTILFDWLDAAGAPVDSGNSVATFPPLPGAAMPDQAALAAAVAAPPPAAPTSQDVRTVLARLTNAETSAIFGSTDPLVIRFRSMALAVGSIQSNDPDAQAGFAYLVAQGLLAANRPAQLLAP